MASEKESFSEIPAKKARIEGDLGATVPCPPDIFDIHLSNGHGEDASVDSITPSISPENCEFIRFPENLAGQGPTSLAESAEGAQSTSHVSVDMPSSSSISPRSEEESNAASSTDTKRKDGNGEEESNDSWSTISDISGLSEDAWKPISGPMSWVQRQVSLGTDPRIILSDMLPDGVGLPEDLDTYSMWRLIINLLMEPPRRKKLESINTLENVVHLLKTCKKIVILTGAGVSVSCGIPDFRSRNGIYARLAVDFPNLPDPQAMFDIHFFRSDQRPFFKFAKEIYPGQFEPSKCHKFIKLLEDNGKLLQNYTQNIDTLEQVAGIRNVIQCHGSFATAQCMACKHKVDAESIQQDIFNQVIPVCPVCPANTPFAIMKPNIVFFGESLPEEFHRKMAEDKEECDLLIVIGSSLKVRPVALIPNSLPSHVPQILINRERLRHLDFDVELLGDCDVIVNELCQRLGWDVLCNEPALNQIDKTELNVQSTDRVCSNIVRSYSDSCELRGDTCLTTSDCNSLDSTSDVNILNSKPENVTDPNSPILDSTSNQNLKSDSSDSVCSDQLVSTAKQSDNSCHSSPCYSTNSQQNKSPLSNTENLDVTNNHIQSFFHPTPRQSLAKRLKDDQFLFMPPNRYVFRGGEVYSDDCNSSEDDSEDDDDEEDNVMNVPHQLNNGHNMNKSDDSTNIVNLNVPASTTKKNYNMAVSHGTVGHANQQKENYEVSVCDLINVAK